MKFAAGLSALVLAGTSLPALAAANAEEAARLAAVFQSYLGSDAGVVTVTPDGPSYDARLDFAPLFARIKQPGFSASLTPIEMTLTSEGGGKWKVDQDQPLTFTFRIEGAIDIKARVGAVKGSGIFDEALGGFQSSGTDLSQFAFEQTTVDPTGTAKVSYTIASMRYDTALAPAGSGADGTVKTSFKDFRETMSLPGSTDGSMPPVDVSITATDGSQDTVLKGLQQKGLLALAAWLAAHSSKDAITAGQAELKERLTAAMPVFEKIETAMVANNISVNTLLGRFDMAKADATLTLNGIVDEGYFREKIAITGFKMPDGLVPSWAGGLAPTDFVIDFDLAGFNLAAPAKLLIANMDLSQEPPLKPEMEEQMTKALLPAGDMTFGIKPSRLAGGLYELKAEGIFTGGTTTAPSGNAMIMLKGIDGIHAALSAAPDELGMRQITPALMMAKGMAKPEADGFLSWKIESTREGAVLVNGADLSKMGGGP